MPSSLVSDIWLANQKSFTETLWCNSRSPSMSEIPGTQHELLGKWLCFLSSNLQPLPVFMVQTLPLRMARLKLPKGCWARSWELASMPELTASGLQHVTGPESGTVWQTVFPQDHYSKTSILFLIKKTKQAKQNKTKTKNQKPHKIHTRYMVKTKWIRCLWAVISLIHLSLS